MYVGKPIYAILEVSHCANFLTIGPVVQIFTCLKRIIKNTILILFDPLSASELP